MLCGVGELSLIHFHGAQREQRQSTFAIFRMGIGEVNDGGAGGRRGLFAISVGDGLESLRAHKDTTGGGKRNGQKPGHAPSSQKSQRVPNAGENACSTMADEWFALLVE
jgi:hypothetical protein